MVMVMENNIKSEVYQYLKFECTNNERPCNNLFNDYGPKHVFKWVEDDFQGIILNIYKYNEYYLVIITYFGSCGGCDAWIHTEDNFHYDKDESVFSQEYKVHVEREYKNMLVFKDTNKLIDHLKNIYIDSDCITKLNNYLN